MNENKLDWVIAGGESGPKARACDVGWIRSIVRQCRAAGVAVFVKQLGSRPYEWVQFGYADDPSRSLVKLRHNHGGDPDEWPEDLRVREFPGAIQQVEEAK